MTLITLFGAVALLGLLQRNGLLPADSPLARLQLPGVDVSVGLLVSLSGLWLSLRSASLGFAPYIVYESQLLKQSTTGLSRHRAGYWRVKIRNVGSGTAIIRQAAAETYPRNSRWPRQLVTKNGFEPRYGEDYLATHISAGYALRPGDELLVFEAKFQTASQLSRLRLRLSYGNALGDRCEKIIDCLPPESDRKPTRPSKGKTSVQVKS